MPKYKQNITPTQVNNTKGQLENNKSTVSEDSKKKELEKQKRKEAVDASQRGVFVPGPAGYSPYKPRRISKGGIIRIKRRNGKRK